jgi:UDP-N-acetyl-D-galactosamine dehydrogenase
MSGYSKIVIMGLGYVGLPLAAAFARRYPGAVVGFDSDANKVVSLRKGIDGTKTFSPEEMRDCPPLFTSDEGDIVGADFYIVAVPTPIDGSNIPDLRAVQVASQTAGKALRRGSVVCYESTVYPGVTEEVCKPLLERASGMRCGEDFYLGYSPERINPGDKAHTLENIPKVVGAGSEEVCEKLAGLYASVVGAGVHKVSSIRAAEACKIVENVQRDLNIALINEMSKMFEMLSIDTTEVLRAAETKWNFLPFKPGLVGGHCIGTDSYYLTHKAAMLGYTPEVVLSARRINDSMDKFVAEKTIKLMCQAGIKVKGSKIGVLGIAFKENVPDIRNSKIPQMVKCLLEYGAEVQVHDGHCDSEEVSRMYGISLVEENEMTDCDALILAVAHREYLDSGLEACLRKLRKETAILVDVKSVFWRQPLPPNVVYWSL